MNCQGEMKRTGSTFGAVEIEQTYNFGVEAPLKDLAASTANLVERVEAGRQSMLQLLQAPHDIQSFGDFGQGPYNPKQGAPHNVPNFGGLGEAPYNKNQGMYGSMQELLKMMS